MSGSRGWELPGRRYVLDQTRVYCDAGQGQSWQVELDEGPSNDWMVRPFGLTVVPGRDSQQHHVIVFNGAEHSRGGTSGNLELCCYAETGKHLWSHRVHHSLQLVHHRPDNPVFSEYLVLALINGAYALSHFANHGRPQMELQTLDPRSGALKNRCIFELPYVGEVGTPAW